MPQCPDRSEHPTAPKPLSYVAFGLVDKVTQTNSSLSGQLVFVFRIDLLEGKVISNNSVPLNI